MAEKTKLKSPTGKTKEDEKALHEMIDKKAHEIYEKRGKEHGKDLEDWLEAERIMKGKKNRS